MKLFPLLLLLAALPAMAATYYVSPTGNNTNPGTVGSPFRTVQKGVDVALPGDTVLVQDGDFNEDVVTKTNGVAVLAINPLGPQLRTFRFSHSTNTIHSFRFRGNTDHTRAWGVSLQGSIRVEPGAKSPTILSNDFGSVFVEAMGFSFNSASNAIASQQVDFISAGFTNGSHVYIGSSGLTNLYPAVHNTAWMVASISADGHALYVTNNVGDTFPADSGTNYWAAIHGGSGSESLYGIYCVLTGTNRTSGITIRGNTFQNMFGPCIMGHWDSGTIEGNTFGHNGGYRFLAGQGSNTLVRRNIFGPSWNPLRYMQSEIASVIHPPGADWFDYRSSVLSWFAANSTNNVVEENIFYDIENQFGLVDNFLTSYGLTYRRNVMIGVSEHFSGGRSDFVWENNTFYRDAYDFGYSNPLTLGGSPPLLSGFRMVGNVFVDCGDHAGGDGTGSTEGWATTTNLDGTAVIVSNWVAAARVLGYRGKANVSEPTFVNGGDPAFVDPENPIGPDGIWWTDDDGLRPIPGSRLATLGWGAYSAPTNGAPVASFSVSAPSGWLDPNTSTTYRASWTNDHPALRVGMQRDFRTAELIGAPPVLLQLTATNAFGGGSSIKSYTWDWGDGTVQTTARTRAIYYPPADAAHWYTATGAFTVTLTITNTAGASDSVSVPFRVEGTPTATIYHVRTNGNDTTGNGSQALPWRTVQKAATNAAPGVFIAVGPGQYGESVDCTKAANPTNRVRFVGIGLPQVARFNLRNADYTIDGFQMTTNAGASSLVYVYSGSHRTEVLNSVFGPATNNTFGLQLLYGGSAAPSASPSFCVISNNLFRGVDYINLYGNGGTNTFIRNRFENSEGQADVFRPFGKGHFVAWNTATNLSNIDEKHTDFFQVFGFRSEASLAFRTNQTMPVDGASLTVNGSVRTWRASVSNPATEILIGANQAACASNLWAHIGTTALPNTTNQWEGSASEPAVTIRSSVSGSPLSYSVSGGWATISTVEQPEVYVQDIVFLGNVMENSRSQVAQIETYENDVAKMTNVWFVSHIFNINSGGALGMAGVKFANCLWIDSTTNTGHAFTGGGSKGRADGTVVKNCAFVRVGSNPASTTAGWYNIQTIIEAGGGTLDANNNFVAGAGYAAKAVAPPNSFQRWGSYGLEANGINGGDPLFVDEAGGNYRLQPSSPLLTAGTNLTGVLPAIALRDLDGFAYPSSGAWPIGPYLSATPAAEPSPSGKVRSHGFRGRTILRGTLKRP